MKAGPATLVLLCLLAAGCGGGSEPVPEGGTAAGADLPAILLVTLDTTRADHVAPEAPAAATPHLATLAARGRRWTHAYTTAPLTLPAHASMLTGLDPSEHGVHENARRLGDHHPLVAEALAEAGYDTAAFVSGFPLDRRFGLARGFTVYDDELGAEGIERRAAETTDRALAWLARGRRRPPFLWVHYYDPHEPYEPPAGGGGDGAAAAGDARARYRAEIAAMDRQLGRLLEGFHAAAGADSRLLVVADHGEGLGDHGEAYHGNLLYQEVMRVPLVVAGDGIEPGVETTPASVRQVHDTLLGWAGRPAPESLLAPDGEESGAGGRRPVLGEAMQPFLQYGWQPQVMVVDGRTKAIRAGRLESYDLEADPGETRDLGAAGLARLAPAARRALRAYPVPGGASDGAAHAGAAETGDTAEDAPLDRGDRERLAALGYLGAPAAEAPPLRPNAPRPASMTHLFEELDRASGLFVGERWAEALPLLERLLEEDPGNLAVALRLAVARSSLGRDEAAERAFDHARRLAPRSLDLAHYRALHLLRAGRLEEAEPLLERVVAASPRRLPALRGLARVRRAEGRLGEAEALLERAAALDPDAAATWEEIGELRMARLATPEAIAAFERARTLDPEGFSRDLELGVSYLAAGRPGEAAAALDRVPAEHPDHALALFKRAQASVLLAEPDRAERVARAWREADEATRELLAREPLFAGLLP